MSLISGSNSLTPVIAGALDFRAAIDEKELLEKISGCNLEVRGGCDVVFVGVFPLKQRGKDGRWCSCRTAVRLRVLSEVNMSDVLMAHNIAGKKGGDDETNGIRMRCL